MTASPVPQIFGFGIVGVGMIAEFHAKAIAAVTGAKLVGVATRNAESAAAFAAKNDVGFHTTSVADLVARPDIHIICVTTPSGAHLDPALAAIRAGKHVVVEKPMEITTARAAGLKPADKFAGVLLSPNFHATKST